MPPRRQREPLFRIGRYWVDTVAGSSKLYRFWYDARTGEVRKRTLATDDPEEAKIALAAVILAEGDGRAREPRDVTLVGVFSRYWTEHSDHRPNPSAARRACNLLLDFLEDDAAKVADLKKSKQVEFLHWLHGRGLSVAYISRVMAIIAAALKRATVEDEDDDRALLLRTPKLIVQPRAVAAVLDAPEPEPRNWHPDIGMLARFLDAIPAGEETRLLRFAILTLVFGRPEAVKQLQPFQIDVRHRLVSLNEPGRRQTKKYRATLPMPEILWKPLLSWREAPTIVHNDKKPVKVLRKPWAAVRAAAGLPDAFTPKSLRHMLATELRRRKVGEEEREMWQGHRRESTNDRYGRFDPDFLSGARGAVGDLLAEIEATAKRPIFRQGAVRRAERPEGQITAVSGG